MEETRITHPGVATVLSFVFNGLGQLYNGQIKKGLLIIFCSSLSLLVFIFGSILIGLWLFGKVIFASELVVGLAMFLLGLVLICILGIYSIVDAYRVAIKK
ncbi:MAG: hypothetical protein DRP74_05030 [Candidatus Omnitrophota bacterium]|nr:MAG: hypothetical protein DRP74_05030 [Candidatus Omnitrophota bacterium]